MTPNKSIDPGVRIGHVHLKVADIERALRFYCDVLGFDLTQRMGDSAAFVSAGGYITTSGSTHGRVAAVVLPVPEPQGYITWQSFTRRVVLSRMRSNG